MDYDPTFWETGDIVTSEKLNNMEDGITAVNKCIVLGEKNSNSITFDLGISAMTYANDPFPLIFEAIEMSESSMKIINFVFTITVTRTSAYISFTLYDPILQETYNGNWNYENEPTSFTVTRQSN